MNAEPSKIPAATRHRTTLIMWGAQLFTLAPLFLLTRLAGPGGPREPNRALVAAFAVAALSAFGASFVAKGKLLAQSVAQQRAELAQTAYVVAYALCEAAALFGVVAHFIAGAPEAVYFFAAAALGLLLHFPRRQHFDDAAGGASGVVSTMR